MLILSNIGHLYDGCSADPSSLHTSVDLLIENGRIADRKDHDPSLQAGERDVLIDASGLTVTPGLIDCHGHITVLGLDTAAMDTMNSQEALLYVERILHTTLVDGGVTTMRDVGGATHLMKRLVDDGMLLGPRLKISICMLSTTGGHADFRGPDRCHGELSRLWGAGPGRPSSIVDGPWECRQRVREIAACGADLIKLCTSPGVASPSDHLEHREFHPDEIEAICDEAHHRGLRVAAHAHSKSGIELAIQHGVDDIQHISFMDERLVEMAAEKNCTVTPTSWVVSALESAQDLSPFVMEKVKQVREVHAAATQHAVTGGLKILGGTDPVLPGMHGRNYMELAYLIKEGLSPLQAWWGSTGLAASEIGQDDTGTLVPGQRADLLLCEGNVLDDPSLLDQGALREVVKDGWGHRGDLEGIPQRSYASSVRDSLWPGEPS
ncbi:MAG: amidohydrolase family protein [Planctomycetota bacterium]|nr:amidohydrolase family protein [Planctomycetota bacterium]